MAMNNMKKVGALLLLGGALTTVQGCGMFSKKDDAPTEVSSALYAEEGDKFGIANSPYKGNADALVTIVVFSEFQCPFCARVNPTLQQILDTFKDDVRIVFKNLPLDFHDRAEPAARAALAAGEQGKFWEFHDLAFQNQRSLTDENFTAWATQLGLDVAKFQADYASDAIKQRVAADAAIASALGVRGTPNFFINGKNVRGAQPFPAFESVIKEELAAMQAAVAGGQTKEQALGARIQANLQAPEAPAQAPPARPQPDPSDVLYVPIDRSPTKGSEKALVTWVIFSEFQCPFCDRIRPTVAQMQELFGDKLRIVYKHNPLDFHPRAEPAARASIAAQNQGKFWEYHDLLFSNMSDLSDEAFIRHAEALGLNLDKFRADMASEETASRVKADMELGRRIAAQGTPHSFINGVRVRGAAPAPQFEQVIRDQIAKAEALTPAQRNNPYEALQANANRGEARMTTPQAQQAPPQAPPTVVQIPVTDANPSKGPADAKVTLVEYTDFECPFCGRFATNLDQALQAPELQGKIRVVVKQFPLGFHANAEPAAQAALAAHAQGKFWEYHDLLWPNMRQLDRASLERYAEQVGLNMTQFRADLDSNKYQAQVRAEFAEGQRFGVQGTPTWFVNGRLYSGALPPDQIKAILIEALNAAN